MIKVSINNLNQLKSDTRRKSRHLKERKKTKQKENNSKDEENINNKES